jgi:hypothetical protein
MARERDRVSVLTAALLSTAGPVKCVVALHRFTSSNEPR